MQADYTLMARLSRATGIVTGIAAEARSARPLGGTIVCSGGNPAEAVRLAYKLIDEGATTLVSFGIAGGLGAGLRPGTLIVADAIVVDQARYPADPEWATILKARVGSIYGGTSIVSNVAEKNRLAMRTGALAVDLESGPVARAASEAGIPFIALRAIADPAWHGLPPAALLPLDEKGRPRLDAVARSIMKRPGQIPGLIAIGLNTRAALNALLRASRVLGR